MRCATLAAAAALVIACGCTTVSPRPDIEGFVYGVQPYDDLPVPSDFTFDDSDMSWAYRLFENTPLNLRSCRLRYVGDRDVGQLVYWYALQMPKHGWQKTAFNLDPNGRRATLIFRRGGDEEAQVDLVREDNIRRPERPFTVLTLRLGAVEGAGSVERSVDAS